MYKALSPIKYNGTVYQTNEVLPELNGEEAAHLLEIGVIAPVKENEVVALPKKAEPKAPKSATPDRTWSKQRVMGYAVSKGLKPDKTATRDELLEMLKNAPSATDEAITPELPKTQVGKADVELPEAPTTDEKE
jgi:hypothetical protein